MRIILDCNVSGDFDLIDLKQHGKTKMMTFAEFRTKLLDNS